MQTGKEILGYDPFPVELLIEIFSYLNLEDISSVARVCIAFGAAINTKEFWELKFRRHFPHAVSSILSKLDPNWYGEFLNHYRNEYSDLLPRIRKIFSLVKEGDIEGLKKLELPLYRLFTEDKNNISILNWAQKTNNQAILDYFYQIAVKNFSINNTNVIDTAGVHHETILYWCIACRQDVEVMKSLFSQGSRFNEKYSSNQKQPIHVAAQVGCLSLIQLLLKNHPESLNHTDSLGQTALIWAASKGHVAIVQYLLVQNGIDLNVTTLDSWESNGRSALHWAAFHGHSEVVTVFMKGVHASVPDAMGKHPIHLAAENDHLEAVRLLIEDNPVLLNQQDSFGQTPLIWAASKGHIAIVEYLLKQNGIDLNAATERLTVARNQNGRTALHWAAFHGHNKVIAALIKAGASASTSGDTGKYPVHLAAENGHLEAVQLFIQNNPALLNQSDSLGQTPLMWAASTGHVVVVEYLLAQNGVDLNAVTIRSTSGFNGNSALHWAAAKGHSEVIAALIKAGASASTSNGTGKYPVHLAAENGHLDAVRLLIENNPTFLNQSNQSDFEQTPLMGAAAGGHLQVVEHLLAQEGIDINAVMRGNADHRDGSTALHWAVDRNQPEIVETLLKHNISLGLTRPIDKSRLNQQTKAKIDLLEYIPKRQSQPQYKHFLNFFGHKINFGCSRERKLAAANALKDVVINGADKVTLKAFKKELNNGELKVIYRNLRI